MLCMHRMPEVVSQANKNLMRMGYLHTIAILLGKKGLASSEGQNRHWKRRDHWVIMYCVTRQQYKRMLTSLNAHTAKY